MVAAVFMYFVCMPISTAFLVLILDEDKVKRFNIFLIAIGMNLFVLLSFLRIYTS